VRAMHDQTMMTRGVYCCQAPIRRGRRQHPDMPAEHRLRSAAKRAIDTPHEKTVMVKDDIDTYLVRAQTIKNIVGDNRLEVLDQRQELNTSKMLRLHQ